MIESIRRALAAYPISPVGVRLFAHHTNDLYRVDTPTGRLALRVSAPGQRTPVEIRSELAWLAALERETDVPVPHPLATRAGRRIVQVGSGATARAGVLFDWMPGRTVGDRVSPALAREAGGVLARLHDHADRFRPRGAFSDTRLDRAWLFGMPAALTQPARVVGWPRSRRALVREAGERVQAWLDGLYTDPRELRFLHLDFHSGNWKRADGQLAVLDFDDTRWAYPVQDLGIALYYLLDGPTEPVLMGAFLDGYARVRPAGVPDATVLQTAVIARQIDLLSYVVAHHALSGADLTRWLGVVEARLRRLMRS